MNDKNMDAGKSGTRRKSKKKEEFIARIGDKLRQNPNYLDKCRLYPKKNSSGNWIWNIEDRNGPKPDYISLGTQEKKLAMRDYVEITGDWLNGDGDTAQVARIAINKMDRELQDRRWSGVLEAYIEQGQSKRTIDNYRSSWKHKCFDVIRNLPLLTTTKGMLKDSYKHGNTQTQALLLNLYNHAKREDWMPQLAIPSSEWKRLKIKVGGMTASISEREHLKIISLMQHDINHWNAENTPNGWRLKGRCKVELQEIIHWLELMICTGQSNTDAAILKHYNVDLNGTTEAPLGHILFHRVKTFGRNKVSKPPVIFPITQRLAPLIRNLVNKAKNNDHKNGYLFPIIAEKQCGNRKRIWDAYRKLAGIPDTKMCDDGIRRKVVIHSYRYYLAEWMAENNILENNQKDILGHQSVIQTRAYAKHAKKKMIPIDIQAKQNNLACNVIQANKAA